MAKLAAASTAVPDVQAGVAIQGIDMCFINYSLFKLAFKVVGLMPWEWCLLSSAVHGVRNGC